MQKATPDDDCTTHPHGDQPQHMALAAAQPHAGKGSLMSTVLPSWNDGTAKRVIIDFVDRVTENGGSDFAPPEDRIATFDNDGTLWCEQPMPVQLFFAFERLAELAKTDPSMRERQPFKAFLDRDMKAIAALGKEGAFTFGMATHAGTTADEFDAIAKSWLAKGEASHARTTVQGQCLSAASGIARLPPCQRFPHFHRLRRRYRPDPRIRRGKIRHLA
ncbi:hypothetical protein [Mesorhizobium sp.]|uniref:hypothetical protein n=1 Tax=Mesorhizobium sp. TaxID=1871066 RepID=UPI00345BB318